MTANEKREIKQTVETAVDEALKNHVHCRFSTEEAERLHQLPKDLDRNGLIMLGRMGRALDAACSWVGRAVVLGVLAIFVWGLAQAIKMGWIDP